MTEAKDSSSLKEASIDLSSRKNFKGSKYLLIRRSTESKSLTLYCVDVLLTFIYII